MQLLSLHQPQSRALKSVVLCGMVGLACCLQTGCISFMANLMHAIHGNMAPAEYDGLENKRVALICTTDEGLRSNATNTILTNSLHAALGMNVEDIELVRQSEVDKWMESGRHDAFDYVEIGKGVDANRVLVVQISNLKLKNGQTLYRGSADIQVTVYNVEDGNIHYRKQIPDFAFPNSGGKPVTETTETKFRSFFLAVVTRKIAGLFYPVDATADYALDATVSSF